MKKNSTQKPDDYELREEYDLAKMTILPRGRFVPQRRMGSNIVVLDPDVDADAGIGAGHAHPHFLV